MEVVDEVLDLGSWHDVRCERGGERRAASGVEARFFAELFVLPGSVGREKKNKSDRFSFDASLKKTRGRRATKLVDSAGKPSTLARYKPRGHLLESEQVESPRERGILRLAHRLARHQA